MDNLYEKALKLMIKSWLISINCNDDRIADEMEEYYLRKAALESGTVVNQ